MKEVESLKTALEADDDDERNSRTMKYVMNPVPDGMGLRYRLTAVGDYREVVSLKRLQDVKRNIFLFFLNYFISFCMLLLIET